MEAQSSEAKRQLLIWFAIKKNQFLSNKNLRVFAKKLVLPTNVGIRNRKVATNSGFTKKFTAGKYKKPQASLALRLLFQNSHGSMVKPRRLEI